MKEHKYTFGKCKICQQFKALKDGICKECRVRDNMPKFFDDLMNGFNDNDDNNLAGV